MSNLCTPWASPPKKKFGGAKFFPNPLGSGGIVQIFSGNSPWKEVPETGFKILGAPPKKNLRGRGVKISQNFAIFWRFCPFLQNGARYQQSENRLLIYGHSSTRCEKIGVLRSTANYVNESRRKHPPSGLIAVVYTERLARGRCGCRYSNSTQ